MNLVQVEKKVAVLEVEAIPVSEKNAIVIYADEGDDVELIEAKAANSGQMVLVVHCRTVESVRADQ